MMNLRHPSKDEAVMVMTEILRDLPSQDREALARFYVGLQPHEEIEAALGMDPDHFRELKASVRAAYFDRTGLGC
jgi:DNA-directed RNA polymerase specialized sigma24 family protein